MAVGTCFNGHCHCGVVAIAAQEVKIIVNVWTVKYINMAIIQGWPLVEVYGHLGQLHSCLFGWYPVQINMNINKRQQVDNTWAHCFECNSVNHNSIIELIQIL